MKTLVGQALFLALALAGCGAEPPPAPTPYRVLFSARQDDRDPVEGVRLVAGGGPLGETGPDGSLRVDFGGSEGTVVPVEVVCPAGYEPDEPEVRVWVRRIEHLFTERDVDAQIDVGCHPELRTAVLLVRARGYQGLPVTLDGQPVAVTDAGGVAQVAVTRPPGAELQVRIVTDARPRLRPESPSRNFTVPATDDFLVFDQPFEERRPPRRRPRPHPTGPVRLQ